MNRTHSDERTRDIAHHYARSAATRRANYPLQTNRKPTETERIELLREQRRKDNHVIIGLESLLFRIASALDTAEVGDSLVEVARLAHHAELELADMLARQAEAEENRHE